MPQPCPAVSPDQTKRMARRLAGAVRNPADDRRAHDIGLGKVGEAHAVEDRLARRQAGQ
jgi:hypothetical protein